MRLARLYGIGITIVILSVTSVLPEAWALSATPASLSFTALVGGPNPPTQTVTFSKNNNRQVSWSSSDSAAWLSATPTAGQLTQSDQIVVTVNISGLNAGVYTATVNITAKKGGSISIPVNLSIIGTVSNTPPPPPPSLTPTTASLSWSANAETDVAGYKVYIGNAAGSYGAPVVLGKVTSYVASNLQYGNTYYFAVSAYDTSGNESALSTFVTKSIY